MRHFGSPARAFTLIELLTVIVILGVVLVVGLPIFTSYKEKTAGVKCVQNLRLIGAATVQYVADHRNRLPYYYYTTADGAGGSGAVTGTWYYNLAAYLGVPRTEVPETVSASGERTRLGTASGRLSQPCVFTCPAHSKEESNSVWKPAPMSWPAEIPVSYAPNQKIRQETNSYQDADGYTIYPNLMTNVAAPGRKIWISDSPIPQVLNISEGRWQPAADGASNYNFPHQGFTRHNQGGNALFFDGHVEWLPIRTFLEPANGSLAKTLRLYFNYDRDPSLDQ